MLLKGKSLLNRVEELKLEHLTKEEIVKECGYYTVNLDGSIRLHTIKFVNALIKAEKIVKKCGGRNANFRISVQKNGNLLVSSAYTKKMDLNPGDEFEIKLSEKHIQLVKIGKD